MLRGPELVTVASWDTETKLQLGPKFVIQKAIPRMQKKPNLVLAFQTPQTSIQNPLAKKFPKGTVVLGAVAGAIQVNNEDEVEYKSKSSLMCASFRRVHSFLLIARKPQFCWLVAQSRM